MKKNRLLLLICSSVTCIGFLATTLVLTNPLADNLIASGAHTGTHHVIEKKAFAPGYYQASEDPTVTSICHEQPASYSYGEKSHWYCLECNKHFADESCQTELALSEFQVNPFTAATSAEIADGDLIALNRNDKQKNVDQGTTATYVKDGGKVAAFISRSNVSNLTEDTTGSEIRFVFDSANKSSVYSVTFEYRLYDVGTEEATCGSGTAHSFIQLNNQSSVYEGYAADLANDDAWHTMTIDTASQNIGALTFKIIGFRGYMLLSNVAINKGFYKDNLYNAVTKDYRDNVWNQVVATAGNSDSYGKVREFAVTQTGTGDVGVGPGNVAANKFTVDSATYDKIAVSIYVPSTVTKYSVISIGWSATVGSSDRETIVTDSTTTGWIDFELNAAYYPNGVKIFQIVVADGTRAGTWKCTSFYGVRKFNSTPLKTVITNDQLIATAAGAENCVLTKKIVSNHGYVASMARTGVPSKIYINSPKTAIESYNTLVFDVYIPASYTVWFFNFITSAGVTQVTPRYADATLVNGWVHVEVNKTSYPAIWNNDILAIQINNVGTNGDAMLLTQIAAK